MTKNSQKSVKPSRNRLPPNNRCSRRHRALPLGGFAGFPGTEPVRARLNGAVMPL